MRRELLAALALTVLLFGSAYLAAGDGRAEEKRETEQAAEDGAADMRAIATAFAQLPKGQLKKVLTEEIIAILAKYGVVTE